MTNYILVPEPPKDIARDVFLFAVGGVQALEGEAMLAPRQRPACMLLFAGLAGAGELRTGEGVYPVREGALLALSATEGAGTLTMEGEKASCVWALLGGVQALCWLREHAPGLPQQPHGQVEGMLRALWHTARLGGAADGFWGSTQAYGLLMKLRAQEAQALLHAPLRLAEQAAALIRANFAYLYGIEELADRLGVSKSHLIRRFTADMGVSPGKYLTRTRMEYAKQLLGSGEYGLDAVAAMCGISGANYFCKVFKAYTGLTPVEYASQAKNPSRSPRPAQGTESGPEQRFYL